MMKHLGEWARRIPLRIRMLKVGRRHKAEFNLSPQAVLEDLRATVGNLTETDLDQVQDQVEGG
jgi:hypothetical protein